MNITVQYRDDNIEAIMSNEHKLLVVSMEGLSLLTNLEDFEAPAKFLKIDNKRKLKFIANCMHRIFKQIINRKQKNTIENE